MRSVVRRLSVHSNWIHTPFLIVDSIGQIADVLVGRRMPDMVTMLAGRDVQSE